MNTTPSSVIIASENPIKIRAVAKGFQKVYSSESVSFHGVSVASGVSDQPRSNEETLQGAKYRAHNAKKLQPDADFWVGVEGGIDTSERGTESFAWIYIIDAEGRDGCGKTGSIILPPVITQLLNEGLELGEADDRVFHTTNSKQSSGAVGILTNDVIDREAFYIDAVIFALVPFIHPELYFE